MFTGLVQHVGTILSSLPVPAGRRILVDPAGWTHHPAVGDSIAVAGCCLTVADLPDGPGGALAFDAVPLTLARTTLADWKTGRRVNLEHAATASTLLGGHLVQGHADGVGRVRWRNTLPGERRLRIATDASISECIAPRGSVCVDGVSLTVAEALPAERAFEVVLVPTTLAKTTLAGLSDDDAVNIETDAIAKQVVQFLKARGN